MRNCILFRQRLLWKIAKMHAKLLEEHKHEDCVRRESHPRRHKALEKAARSCARSVDNAVCEAVELTSL